MFVVEMLFDKIAMDSFEKNMKRYKKRLKPRMRTVVNRAARFAVNKAVEEVRKELNLKVRDIKGYYRGKHDRKTGRKLKHNQQIFVSKKATPKDPSAAILIAKMPKMGLGGAYSAKQNTRGTSYRISKKKGRQLANKPYGAFMGPKPGVIAMKLYGGVFMRTGKARLPIRKLFGPSVWGAFTKNHMERVIKKAIRKRLRVEMDRTIKQIKGKDWVDPDKAHKAKVKARAAKLRERRRKYDFMRAGGGF